MPLISICIPSYNRPKELLRLLRSIDCTSVNEIEIVVREDKSPLREQIRESVKEYEKKTQYSLRYIENEINLGYDGNLRALVDVASGKYVLFMGDDDVFVPGALDMLVQFLQAHPELAFVLRSYYNTDSDGKRELFRYYTADRFFLPGPDSYTELFRRCVFISGFTCDRQKAYELQTDRFDGTLLYQLYLEAEICMNYPSAYFDTPLTQSFDGGEFFFGASEAEKGLFQPNRHTIANEVQFISGFFVISSYMDAKYSIDSTTTICTEMSKYSFPMLALIAENGKRDLREYYLRLKEFGFDCTPYFRLYYMALLCFGPSTCRQIIKVAKKILGHTPHL